MKNSRFLYEILALSRFFPYILRFSLFSLLRSALQWFYLPYRTEPSSHVSAALSHFTPVRAWSQFNFHTQHFYSLTKHAHISPLMMNFSCVVLCLVYVVCSGLVWSRHDMSRNERSSQSVSKRGIVVKSFLFNIEWVTSLSHQSYAYALFWMLD